MARKKIEEVVFFPNGNTFVADKKDEQISELQKSWFLLYIGFLKAAGYTNDEIAQIRFTFPNTKTAKYMPEYNNWKFDN